MPAVGASWLWALLGFACYSKRREPAQKRPFHLSYVSIKDAPRHVRIASHRQVHARQL